jgi:cell division protein FtsZ
MKRSRVGVNNMPINITVPESKPAPELKPNITVVGVGGAGGNAVNNMIQSELQGVDFIAANTDAQALGRSQAEDCLQLGMELTQGLGAGSRPEVGRGAAEEAIEDITNRLRGTNMLFIAAGMGGGTGTGAAPVIARIARELGVLTVGVVTKPFKFEGPHRMRLADAGIEELERHVDSLIVIPNQNLFRRANEKTTFTDAFAMADDVLYSGVRGVTDLIVKPGLINLDFADIRSVMSEMGKALMGTGEAEGEGRAIEAAETAISNPLLDVTSMEGAKGILVNITGGLDMTLFEVDECTQRISQEVGESAYIYFGSALDETMEGKMRVSVVATGIDQQAATKPRPATIETLQVGTARPISQGTAFAPAAITSKIVATEEKKEKALQQISPPEPKEVAETTKNLSEETEDQDEAPSLVVQEENKTPPEAMPGIHSEEAFIPPPPVDSTNGQVASQPDPFFVAASANEKADGENKKLGLFARITGGEAKEVNKTEEKTMAYEEAADHVSQLPGIEPALEETLSQELVEEQSDQGELTGLSRPASQAQDTAKEEDFLEIPAFLRRQAN